MKFNNGVRKKHIKRSAIKKRLTVLVAVFFVMFVGIGYAYVKRTLNINNNTKISNLSWNLHLDSLDVATGSVTPLSQTVISQDNMSITSNLEFKNDGEFYEYTVDVVNDGSINAMIESVEGLTLTNEQSKYFDYSATWADGTAILENQQLPGGTREKIKVRISLKDNLTINDLPSESVDVKFTLKLNYIQANNNAVRIRKVLNVTRQNEGQITQGDVVTFSYDQTQKYYVLSTDQDNTVLFAETPLATNGKLGTDFELVKLASSSYWKDKIGEDYTGSYEGNPYPYVYDQNTTVYNLLERYKNKLTNSGINVSSIRLISYEDLQGLSSEIVRGYNSNYTYLTGSASDDDYYWVMASDGTISQTLVTLDNTFAVRPVIVVPNTELN